MTKKNVRYHYVEHRLTY